MHSFKYMTTSSFIISATMLLFGCAEMKTSKPTEIANSNSEVINEEINSKCESEIVEVEIFQVLGDSGALANVCNTSSGICMGMVVAVPLIVTPVGEVLYDKKKIKAPKDKCIVINGAYKYKANNGMDKTVPIIGFDYKFPPANEEEAEKRMQDGLDNAYDRCLAESINVSGLSKAKSSETCKCYVDSFVKLSNERDVANGEISYETFIEKWIKQSGKKCGLSPKNMKWFR